MTERFIEFLFKRMRSKIGDISEAGSHEEVDTFLHELGDYVDELHGLVKEIITS